MGIFSVCIGIHLYTCTVDSRVQVCAMRVHEPRCSFKKVSKCVLYEILIILGINFRFVYKNLILIQNFTHDHSQSRQVNLTNISHHPFSPFSICTANCKLQCTYLGCSQNQFNQNVSLTSEHFIFFITFLSGEFQC